MPKNAAIIGRVAVKVLPDTGSFRQDAQRELDAVEREIKPIEVTINPKVDLNQLVQEVNRAHEVAQAALRDITLHVNVDTRNIGGLNDVNNSLNNLNHTNNITFGDATQRIDFQVDETSRAAALIEVGKFREQINKDMTVHVDFDVDDPSKQKALAELRALGAEVHDLIADIKVDVDSTKKIKADAELMELARTRYVSLKPNVDDGAAVKAMTAIAALSGARVWSMKVEGVSEMISAFDTAVPMIGAMTLGLGQLTSIVLASASSLLSLSANLLTLSGLAFALPGIFAGIGIGMGITMLALKDMKKALPDVYAEWQNVKNAITEDFWTGASKGIRELAGIYLPELHNTARAVGQFWGDFAHNLTSALGPTLPNMFRNLNDSIAIMSSHTGAFSGIISTLGTVGAAQLPRLATFVGNVGEKFNTWLAAKESSGQLQAFIDEAITTLKQLGEILHQAGRIFEGLMKAATAGGGATLQGLGDGLKKIADTVNSPQFQAALTGVFQAAHDAIHNLADTAGPAFKDMMLQVGQTLQFILPMIGSTLGTAISAISTVLADPAVQQGIQSLVIGLKAGIDALAPAFATIGPALGAILDTVGQFLTILGPIFASTLGALAPLVTTLLPPINSLISILGQAFVTVLSTLEPVIQGVADAFANFMANGGLDAINAIMQALVPIIQQLGTAFGGILQTALQAAAPAIGAIASLFGTLMTALGPVITSLMNSLMPVIPVIANAFVMFANAIGLVLPPLISGLAPIIPILANLMANMYPVLGQLAQTLASSLAPVLPVIADLFVTLVRALAPVLPMLISALAPILPIIVQAIGAIVTAITPLIPVLVNLLQAVIMPLLPLFLSLVQSILLPLAPIIQNLVTSLTPFITALTQIAMVILPILVPIIQMLADVLIGAVMGAISGVVNMFTGFMDILTGVWEIVSGIFTGNWSKVWQGIQDVFKGVFEFIGGLIQFVWNVIIIATFMDGVGFIKDLWTGFWGLIKGSVTDTLGFVGKFIGDIWSFIKGLFNDGVGAISRLWNGLWQGVKDFFGTIWGGIKGAISGGLDGVVSFFTGLPGRIMDALVGLSAKLLRFGGDLVSGMWDGISGAASWFMQKIGNFFGSLLPGWVKDILGIHSPSRVFADLGKWLLPGLAAGMESDSSLQSVKDAVGVMHSTLVAPIDTGLLYESGTALASSLLDGMESQYDAIKSSLAGLGDDLAGTAINPVVSAAVSGSVNGAANSSMSTTPGGNVLIYNAAPNSSIDSNEDLFSAATRARMGW